MRFRQSAVLVVAAATGIVTVPAVSAAGAVPTVLFVNKTDGCSDTGSGTEATPFCSISAAAAVVLPGQTVQVAMGYDEYEESVHVTHSGTPEQPITFVGRPVNSPDTGQPWVRPEPSTDSAFVLDGVHDVVVRGFQLVGGTASGTPTVQVTDSQRVSVDGNTVRRGGVTVTGAGDHVTVSRNYFNTSNGVSLGAGVRDSLVTANEFFATRSVAVSALDAPNTAVTNNTIAFSCGESVKIDGASTGALIENNLITAGYTPSDVSDTCGTTAAGRGETEISVSAGSTSGSKVDYNSVHPWSDANAYTWSGTSYRTAAAFAAAQPGQAANDIDVDFTCQTASCAVMPYYRAAVAHPALADSADPDAPGVGTDLRGFTYADNPGAPSGPKGGVRDRGAFEATGQRDVELAVTGTSGSGTMGKTPFTVTATVTPRSDWPIQQADYLVNFGDGTAPVHSTSPTVTHTYVKAGTFYPSVVVTDRSGARASVTGTAIQTATTELAANPEITVTPGLYATIVPNASTPWRFTSEEIDFGDGTPRQSQTYPQGTYYHQYMVPGDYPLTMTHRDDSGKVLVTKATVHAVAPRDAAALQPGKRVQLLARSANDWLSDAGANYDKGVWGPFLPVPTTGATFATKDVTAMASTATADQYLRAFALAGGKVYSADRNLGPASGGVAQGQWLPWKEVTGANGAGSLSGITQIATASTGNRIHVLALAGGRVYEASGDRASGTWSKWGDITAALGFPANTTSVSAAFIGNVLHVAMLGSDGHIRVGDGDYDRGRWSGGDMTGAIGFAWPNNLMHPTQVVAAATPDGKLHVFTMALGKLLESGGDYVAGRWSPWADVTAATGLSTPNHTLAVAPNGMTLRVFAMDAYGNISEVDGDYAAGRWSKSAYVNTSTGAGLLSGTTVITAAGL